MADANAKYFKVNLILIRVLETIGVQEKELIMSVRYGSKNLSLGSHFGITQQSLVMPNCNPGDRFLDQYLTLMRDSYNLKLNSSVTYLVEDTRKIAKKCTKTLYIAGWVIFQIPSLYCVMIYLHFIISFHSLFLRSLYLSHLRVILLSDPPKNTIKEQNYFTSSF